MTRFPAGGSLNTSLNVNRDSATVLEPNIPVPALLFYTLGTSPSCPPLFQFYPTKLKLYFTRKVPFFLIDLKLQGK